MVFSREDAAKRAEASKTTSETGICQLWTRTMFGAPSAGDRDNDHDADAMDGWKSEPVSARHTDRNPPRGVPVAYSGGSNGFGHRAVSLGNGMIRSTDANGSRRNATVPLNWPEKKWGLKYVGWSETITGIPIPKGGKPVAQKTQFIADLAHYQFDQHFNLELLGKQGYAAVILKCTQDIDWHDKTYPLALATAKKLKYMVAVYHFLERGHGAQQAENLANHILDKSLPVYIDVEPSTNSRPKVIDWIEFRKRATQLGLKVKMKYLTEAYWEELGKPSLVGPLKLWRAAYPTMNHDYASKLYPGNDHARWNAFGGQTPTFWQFTSNAKVDGFKDGIDVSAFRGTLAQLKKTNLFKDYSATSVPTPKPTPKPVPTPTPKPEVNSATFRVHLVPGNKKESAAQIKADMATAKKKSEGGGASIVVFNTERETAAARKAVADGLGKGFTCVLDNENTIGYGSNWSPSPGLSPKAILLAKDDPSMEFVSPRRYLEEVPLIHKGLEGVTIDMDGLHLVSEANCKHVNVKGRAWREKTWPIQVDDVLDELEARHKYGVPAVVVGDFNTGVKFTGKQLFALFQKRFGNQVVHVHNGGLDHIFLISTDKVKLEEVGTEVITDNNSDHNMVTSVIKATKLK